MAKSGVTCPPPGGFWRRLRSSELGVPSLQKAGSGISSARGLQKMMQMLQLWFLTHVMGFCWKLRLPVSDFPTSRNYRRLIVYLYRGEREINDIGYSAFLTRPACAARAEGTGGSADGTAAVQECHLNSHKARHYPSPGPLCFLWSPKHRSLFCPCLAGTGAGRLRCELWACCRTGDGGQERASREVTAGWLVPALT